MSRGYITISFNVMVYCLIMFPLQQGCLLVLLTAFLAALSCFLVCFVSPQYLPAERSYTCLNLSPGFQSVFLEVMLAVNSHNWGLELTLSSVLHGIEFTPLSHCSKVAAEVTSIIHLTFEKLCSSYSS